MEKCFLFLIITQHKQTGLKMEIYTSPRYKNGSYIIYMDGGFVGLSNINFLDDDCTIKEYKEWYRKHLENVLPLSDKSMGLQTISIGSITHLDSISDIIESEFEKTDLKKEDIVIPFIGGLIGYDFRELCNRLWEVKNNKDLNYYSEVRKYYAELFESHKTKDSPC